MTHYPKNKKDSKYISLTMHTFGRHCFPLYDHSSGYLLLFVNLLYSTPSFIFNEKQSLCGI